MRLTTALAPAWNQNNAEPSAAFVAHIEAAFIEPRHDQHDSRLAQHIPRIAERFVGVRSMTVLVLDPLTEDAMDGVTRADLQGVWRR
jgi:hypothetical protein